MLCVEFQAVRVRLRAAALSATLLTAALHVPAKSAAMTHNQTFTPDFQPSDS
jgi:hypothetical protein